MAAYTMPSVGPSISWRRSRSSISSTPPLAVSSTIGAPIVVLISCPALAPNAGTTRYSRLSVLTIRASSVAMPAPPRNANVRFSRGSGSSRSIHSRPATIAAAVGSARAMPMPVARAPPSPGWRA